MAIYALEHVSWQHVGKKRGRSSAHGPDDKTPFGAKLRCQFRTYDSNHQSSANFLRWRKEYC